MQTGKFFVKIAFLMLLCLSLTACGSADALVNARMQWTSFGPDAYEITVRYTQSVWHSQAVSLKVDGEIVSHSATCTPAPTEGKTCEVKAYDPQDYTVEGLFQTAEEMLSGNYGKHVTVEYDETYGYPTRILLDDPDLIDEDQAWGVIAFEALD